MRLRGIGEVVTDRINGFWVALAEDTRTDDAEPIIAAVMQLRGVIAVEPRVTDSGDWIATARVRRELTQKLWDALKETR